MFSSEDWDLTMRAFYLLMVLGTIVGMAYLITSILGW